MKRGAGFNGGFISVDMRNSLEGVIGWEKNFYRKSLALDRVGVTGLQRAFSVRRLLTSYDQWVIKARNSTSGVIYPISYVAEDLDSSFLLSSMSGSSGTISEVADQSGSGVVISQSSIASQPIIVNAGVIQTIGSKPTMVFDGSNDSLVSPDLISGLTNGNPFTIMLVFNKTNNSQGTILNQGKDASYFHYGLVSAVTSNSISWRNSNNDFTFGSNVNSSNQSYVMCAVSNGGVTELFRNNVSIGTTTNAITASSPVSGNEFAVGKRAGHSSEFIAMKISEIIIYARALSAQERSLLVVDAMNYFSIV